MKKNYLRSFTILILLSSCENSSDNKKITIDNFNEKFVDSLIPNSNDTIRLNLSSNNTQVPSPDYYFIGDFEEEIRLGYYGESNQYVTFDPYKATKGNIKLNYRL